MSMVSLSALCPTRASSWSARAGTIASSSRPGPAGSVVSLTLNRYESVAAITSLSPSKRTRMPVSTGRDSSREADLPTREIVSRKTSRSTVNALSGSISGRRGKSSAA